MKTFASKIYEQYDFENTKNLITKLATGEITVSDPNLANLTPLATTIYSEEFYLKTSAAAKIVKTTGHAVPKELKIARLRAKKYSNLVIQLTEFHKSMKIVEGLVESNALSTLTILDIAKPYFPQEVDVAASLPSLIYHSYGTDIPTAIVKEFEFPIVLDLAKDYWQQEVSFAPLIKRIAALTIASGTSHLASLAKINWVGLSDEFAAQKQAASTYLNNLRSMARSIDTIRPLVKYFKPKS